MAYSHNALIAVLTATTLLTSGAVWAANETKMPDKTMQQTPVDKDFGKLSADGARAFQDVTLARLSIFDGRIEDAKKYVNEADQDFGKAKTDDTVFMKAEGDLPPAKSQSGSAEMAKPTASADQTKQPIAWLPVDGSMVINEDYSASQAKSAAVAEANKSLKNGDHKTAIAKLKLANMDVDVTVAVVPLQKTISDVHQAASLINDGKYYEGSQMLKHAQDNEHFVVTDISGMPKTSKASAPVASATPNPPSTTK